MIFEAIVLATPTPSVHEPVTSNMDATINACFIVRIPAPTVVPNEFATSLAPLRSGRGREGGGRRKEVGETERRTERCGVVQS